MGITGDVTGLNIKAEKDRVKRENEFRNQLRNEAAFNYGQERRSRERMEDLLPQMTGNLSTDFVGQEMVLPQGREDIGGAALESLLNASQGYNPVMGADPAMQVLAGDRQMVNTLQDQAQYGTEQTLSDWERNMSELAESYEGAREDLGARRDEAREAYTERVEEDRGAEQDALAETIVKAWVESNDKSGTLGEGRFRNEGVAGRYKGANKKNKRAYVNELLSQGMDYEDLVNDPDFAEYLYADRNASTLLGQYEGDAANPGSAKPDPADYGGEQTAGYRGALAEWEKRVGRR